MPDLPIVGKVPKGWVIAVVGGSVVVGGYLWYRHKQNAVATSSTATTSSTAPTGTGADTTGDPYPPDGTYGNPEDPYSTDPETGMTYGDEQLYGGDSGYGLGSGYYPGTGVTTTGTGGTPGPGSFTTNADWASYAEEQLQGVVDPTSLSAALGVYLTGRPANDDQVSLIDQAIAIAGYPPVSGPGNNPPGIVQGSGGGGGKPKVKVPNVVGQDVDAAARTLTGAGFQVSHPSLKAGHGYTVTAEQPPAGRSVDQGRTITLTIKEKK
jgi:PASTA domain